MKFGLFQVRNGHISFKLFNDADKYGATCQTDKGYAKIRSATLDAHSLAEEGSVAADKHSMIGSMNRKDLSVRTPSLGGTVLTKSLADQAHSYVHVSNPNPQPGKKKFASVRDQGYSAHVGKAAAKAGLSLIHTHPLAQKFGKRVFMGNSKMSDREVFDLHMQ
jgi:hypothetical protein